MICYLHCTFRYKDELRVSPSVFDAAQAYEPLLSRSSIVRCKVSVFSPVILIPYHRAEGGKKKCLILLEKNGFPASALMKQKCALGKIPQALFALLR